jgi:hypothetical protein
MRRSFPYYLLHICLFIISACSKPPVTPVVPPVIPPVVPPVVVPPGDNGNTKDAGQWECLVDGIPYSGTIDTVFSIIDNPNYTHPDTMVTCTGTSADKKANIAFNMLINRYAYSSGFSNREALFAFDTMTPNYNPSFSLYRSFAYQIDSFAAGRLNASFSGIATSWVANRNITKGKLTCNIGKGRDEPKFLGFQLGSQPVYSFINSARLVSNALIMDAIPLTYGGAQTAKLIIRTGGTIKPGTYKSQDGDAGFYYYVPSYLRSYITDSLGDLSVTITTVTNNIVSGYFSGASSSGETISNGNFKCRVKNYAAEAEGGDTWRFYEDEPIFNFNVYGGNIISASRLLKNGRYSLTLNGESDNNTSAFRMVISSDSAITAGQFSNYTSERKRLDSIYFRSPTKLWNGNTTSLYSYVSYDDRSITYCKIDSINEHHVWGTIGGKITIFLSPNGITSATMKKGKFSASF